MVLCIICTTVRLPNVVTSALKIATHYERHCTTNVVGPSLSLPDRIRENCQEEGYELVNRYNTGQTVQGYIYFYNDKLFLLINAYNFREKKLNAHSSDYPIQEAFC